MKHRVFLSSTFSDLKDYRETVREAIRQLGAEDVSMENFGARDERPLEECVRLVKQESDLFVGIYAHRYGYIPDGETVSISELEYRAASEAALPRFIFIVDREARWLVDDVEVGAGQEKLRAFKEMLLKRHMCQTFKGPDQLATRVVAAIGRHIAAHDVPRVGPGIPVPNIPVPDIGFESSAGPVFETPDEWNRRRNSIYEQNRNLFLTHFIKPTSKAGQQFDVFIYLLRHGSDDLSDVHYAEFFLGKYWENKVFPAVLHRGFIGIQTAAYGTFLCLCRVTFKDGGHVYLHRYIDFEMQRTGG